MADNQQGAVAVQRYVLDHTHPGSKGAYEVVRAAAGLPAERLPDAMIEAIWSFAGEQVRNPYELAVAIRIAERHGLDLLGKEVFAFRTKNGLQVWAGRDGFLKAAQRQPNYNGHKLGVVFPGEEFRISVQGDDVLVFHEMNGFPPQFDFKDTDTHPIGGYCVAYSKNGRPVVIRRRFNDYRYLWTSDKKENWRRHPIDMFENRLLRAGLTRVVALGDLAIEGDDWGDRQAYLEEQVGTATRGKIRDLKARIEGLGRRNEEEAEELVAEVVDEEHPELSAEEAALARLKGYRTAFEDAVRVRGFPAQAILAWSKNNASLDDDPQKWTEGELVFALQAVAEAEGRDVWQEYGRWLIERAGLHGGERIIVEDDILNAPDVDALRKVLERLEERVPSQRRKP